MNNARKESKHNPGPFFRITPRNSSNSKIRSSSREQALMAHHGHDDMEDSSIHTNTSISSHSHPHYNSAHHHDHHLDDDDDDPVEMLKQLRTMKKARQHLTKGLDAVTQKTSKIVKGTSRNVAKKSHKMMKGSQKVARSTRAAMSSGRQTSPSIQHQSPDYDVEAAAAVMTESDPLIPCEPKNTVETENDSFKIKSDNTTTAPSSRTGAALWAKLRDRKDEVVFSMEEREESVEVRKSRHQKEIQDEFRNALEFSLSTCLFAIFVYLGIAVLAFSFLFEHWTIIDSMYFAVVSFTTIGYGDIVPTTEPSRVFTAFFALSGVACLGIALGVLGSNLVEAQTKAIDQASELSQYQVMSLFESSQKVGEVDAKATHTSHKSPWYRSTFVRVYLPLFALLFLFCWLLGNDAGWDSISTFYYCIITATTVGYGDLSPQTQSSRLFAIPVILLAVGAMGNWLSVLADAIIDRRQATFRERFQARELTLADLEVMDADEDGKVTLAEYLAFMLVSMQKVDQELIEGLITQFDRLDVDGTGCLDKEDLVIVAKRKLKSPKRKLELSHYKQQLLAQASGKSQEEKSAAFSLSLVPN